MNYEMADIEIIADEMEARESVYRELSFSKHVIRHIRAWVGGMAVVLGSLAIPAYGGNQPLPMSQNQPIARITVRKLASDVETIAKVLYIEARGESELGMRGTASVMWYRGNGDSKQIAAKVSSLAWNGKVGQKLLRTVKPYGVAWERAKKIAMEIASGVFVPPIRANLVHATSIAKPRWHGAVRVATIGRQVFYYAARVV